MEIAKEKEAVRSFEIADDICGNECRICLKNCPETCQIFGNNDGIPQKIMAIATVQVEEGDGLPATICLLCYQRLDISYNLKCQVQHSDEKLRQVLRLKSYCRNDNKDLSNSKEIDNGTILPKQNIPNFAEVLSQNINTIATDDTTVQPILQLDIQNYTREQNVFISGHVEDNININNKKYLIENRLNDARNLNKFHQNNCTSQDYESHLCTDINNQNCETSTSNTDANYIKQESASFPSDRNEQVSRNENVIEQNEMFKMEIKNDMSLENDNGEYLAESGKVINDNSEVRLGTNCSDDEKPLISRTLRQKCPYCIKSFATKVALQRHMIIHKHKTKLRYVCYICDKQFLNISKLKNHVYMSHETDNKSKINKSKEDNKVTRKEMQEKNLNRATNVDKNSDATENMKTERKSFKYTCKVCSKQFTYQKSFLSHAKTHPEYKAKGDKAKYMASACKENESEEEGRDNQEEEEEEEEDDSDLPMENLQCTQCGKLFATKRNLKRHISTHSGLKFNCPACDKAFSRIDKLKDHEQSKHKEELFGNSDDDAENDTDNENKINESSENRKKERHNRPHKCAMCPKAFAQAQSLANHMERHKRVKDTQKRFLCEVCSKCFAQSGSLVAHMRTHTGVKPYVCNVCSRAFTKSTYLQLHLRTHSGEKPYICQYCSRAFARANTLARHITMHTGEAKYHCQICTKSFRRLTSLNEHTYTHTGQRPYACKICTKRYNNAGSLYAHTKKCKAQQLSGNTQGFAVSIDNSIQQNDAVPQVLIYSQRKLVEDATVGQVTPTPQYMIPNVHNQKILPNNIIQPFAVEESNLYTVNSKQFKNPYYAIYPNM